MGPHLQLTRQTLGASGLWSQVTAALDGRTPREVVAVVAAVIASARGIETPSAFDDIDTALLVAEPWAEAFANLPDAFHEPEVLGIVWEYLLDPGDRKERGAHFTPPEVAATVVDLGIAQMSNADTPTVWDPTAGGGAFLLATVRALAETSSASRAELVARCYASDIDPIALDVCDASLQLWAQGASRPTVRCIDSLVEYPDDWPEAFGLVVGNPPFLSQLATATSRSNDRAKVLAERFPGVGGGYVDDAGLFLALGTGRLEPGGVLALVLPESLLAATAAEGVRDSVGARGELAALWIDEGQSFEAAVDVVAVVVVCSPERHRNPMTTVYLGHRTAGPQCVVATPEPRSWAPLLAAASGVPMVSLDSSGATIGSFASFTAGFRQHYYGIEDAVQEMVSVDDARLITAGSIEPLRLQWGERPTAYARKKWMRPTVVVEDIADASVREWFEARATPKILLASQTRIVEAYVDLDGTLMPSVPVITATPTGELGLWQLAAALTAPAASAWFVSRSSGSGLSRNAVRLAAAAIGELPVPVNSDAWNEGAERAAQAQASADEQDWESYAEHLRAFGHRMDTAFEVDERVGQWWWERVRLPTGVAKRAY